MAAFWGEIEWKALLRFPAVFSCAQAVAYWSQTLRLIASGGDSRFSFTEANHHLIASIDELVATNREILVQYPPETTTLVRCCLRCNSTHPCCWQLQAKMFTIADTCLAT